MQEEVNEKTVSLCITGGKVTVRLLKQAMIRFLAAVEKEKAEKARKQQTKAPPDAVNTFLSDEIDKMKVRPGITGLSQAYYRNSVSPRKKRLLDAWYANNATLIIDVKIFLKTIETVFKHENLYSNTGTEMEEENIEDNPLKRFGRN